MRDEEHLTPLERTALAEKRYRRSRIISAITFGAFWILLLLGMLLIGYLKGFI